MNSFSLAGYTKPASEALQQLCELRHLPESVVLVALQGPSVDSLKGINYYQPVRNRKKNLIRKFVDFLLEIHYNIDITKQGGNKNATKRN